MPQYSRNSELNTSRVYLLPKQKLRVSPELTALSSATSCFIPSFYAYFKHILYLEINFFCFKYRIYPNILAPFQYAQVPLKKKKSLHHCSDYTTHPPAELTLCDSTLQEQEELELSESPALYTPHPPVNRDKFSLTKWFLGKAELGAMETRQLSCQRAFLFPGVLLLFLLCPRQYPSNAFHTSLPH